MKLAMLKAMHTYVALLGRNPALSRAELQARLLDLSHARLMGEYLFFQTSVDIDQAFLDTLGGTILIAKKLSDGAMSLEDLPALLATELKGTGRKAIFSLRLIGINPRTGHDLFRKCKGNLKKNNVPSRYVGNEREPAKTVQLHDEGLLDPKKGCELTVIVETGHVWIGRTVAAQNIKSYSKRDMEKPVRDTMVGLLPPKLAQLLLNFGEYLAKQKNPKLKDKLTVLDPFCGTGVVPMEAMLRGFDVLGSDVSLKAVNGTTKNVEWLRKEYKVAKKDVDCEIWKQDATKPFELKKLPDMIVTEGTLGPALKSRPNLKDAETFMKDSDALTLSFLTNCKATLPGVPVVMTLPVWYAQKRFITLKNVWANAEKLGYKAVMPAETAGSMPGRTSILYRRDDQFVGREIVLLLPQS